MTFDNLIEEIVGCLNDKHYYAALSLSLIIPDICSKIEFEDWNKRNSGLYYKKWYNEFIGKNESLLNQYYNCENYSWIDEDIVYSLRCNIFHEGFPKINKNSIKRAINKSDIYYVDLNESSIKSKISTDPIIENKTIINRTKFLINGPYLSRLLVDAGKIYYLNNKDKFPIDNSIDEYYSNNFLFYF